MAIEALDLPAGLAEHQKVQPPQRVVAAHLLVEQRHPERFVDGNEGFAYGTEQFLASPDQDARELDPRDAASPAEFFLDIEVGEALREPLLHGGGARSVDRVTQPR